MIIDMVLESVYLVAVAVIWLMLVYQVILTFSGYLYSRRRRAASNLAHTDLPFVSIMIPARNEARVIADTLKHMFSLDYPHDKLEVIVINDGSTDGTKEILESSKDKRLKVINVPKEESGRGKSRVLNTGLKSVSGEIIAIYDADNRPHQDSLKLLVGELIANPEFVAAIGKFRTINKDKSIVTRFINIESLSFQWIIQAGRSFLFDIAILPGTNFVIRKQPLIDVGGWDEGALTEDAELSLKLYKAGWKIKFVPGAITREQEPDSIRVWLKQRERWVRGNNYVTGKILKDFWSFKNKVIGLEFLVFGLMYYVFFIATILSDIFFILGLFNIVTVRIQGPFLEVWIAAYMLFVSEIVLTLSREPGEDGILNIFYVIMMYFTYCQLWLIVVSSAFIKDFIKKEKAVWYKTERTIESSPGEV
jgi:cellulose synthase/poly-beta-1,6-N-acetylglucosamine synthase-like glycosyltransferase